jgi:hypothetical protein
MICGYPPFYGDNDAEILESVKKGIYDFEGKLYKIKIKRRNGEESQLIANH